MADTEASHEAFDPTQYLLGLVQASLQTGQAQQFSYVDAPPLYVLPSERRCFTQAIDIQNTEETDKRLYTASIAQIAQKNLTTAEIYKAVAALHTYPIETALWQSALYASKGRLMTSSERHCFIQLEHWPPFNVLPHGVTRLRLAAFMLKNSTDLETIAAKTETNLSTVINFVNACEIIGLIKRVKSPKLNKCKELSNPRRYLLKDIQKRLYYE